MGRCNEYWWMGWSPLEKKRWALCSVSCDQNCLHAYLSLLKALAVNSSWPSGWNGLYASLRGPNRWQDNALWRVNVALCKITNAKNEIPRWRLYCCCQNLFLLLQNTWLHWHHEREREKERQLGRVLTIGGVHSKRREIVFDLRLATSNFLREKILLVQKQNYWNRTQPPDNNKNPVTTPKQHWN